MTTATLEAPLTQIEWELYRPPRKETTRTSIKSERILVVSPYSNFNRLAQEELSYIMKGTRIDVVDRADINQQPYLRLPQREIGVPTPLFVIDFQKIVAKIPSPEEVLKLRRNAIYDWTKKCMEETLEELRTIDLERFSNEGKTELKKVFQDVFQADVNGMDIGDIFNLAEINTGIPIRDVVVKSDVYNLWCDKAKVSYVRPEEKFSSRLENLHKCDDNGNFDMYAIDFSQWKNWICKDFEAMRDGGKTKLFQVESRK